MPRPIRIQEPGYIHHVICMGNNHQPIFNNEGDFKKYLKFLKEEKDLQGMKLYNFVLMNNHLHLLVEAIRHGSISRVIQNASRNYAKYFNKRYRREGHVFQRRYKSLLIQEERYFFCCLRYIDLNPVKAFLVKNPQEFLWSGHRSLAYGEKSPIALDSHCLYESLGASPQERQAGYRLFITHFQGEEIDLLKFRGHVLGDENFKEKMHRLLK